MQHFKKAFLPVLMTAAIVGCSNDEVGLDETKPFENNQEGVAASSQAAVRFAPSSSDLPFPTDLLFSGTVDGSINVPGVANTDSSATPVAAALADPQVALNTMDGFSTTSPIIFKITGAVDTSAILAGTAVRVIKVDTTTDGAFNSTACLFLNLAPQIDADGTITPNPAACAGFDAGSKTAFSMTGSTELTFGVDYVTSVSTGADGIRTVAILPIKPLDSFSTYMVSVSRDAIPLASDPDKRVNSDTEYAIAKSTFPLFYLSEDLARRATIAATANPDPDEATIAGFLANLAAALNAGAPFNTLGLSNAQVAEVLDTVLRPQGMAVSCTFAKSLADTLDAAASTAFAADISTDCSAELSLLSDAATASSFEQLRQRVNAHESALAVFDGNATPADIATARADMALVFAFSTQNIGSALAGARSQIYSAGTSPTIDIHNELSEWSGNPSLALVSPGADGDPATGDDHGSYIFLGTLQDAIQFADPANPNTTTWQGLAAAWANATFLGSTVADACAAAFPDTTSSDNLVACNGYLATPVVPNHKIPVIISAPRAEFLAAAGSGPGQCAEENTAGLPIVIYQHGIGTNRATLMAIADALGNACLVGVGIDMPKHGIMPVTDPFGLEAIAAAYQGFQQLDGVAPADLVPERLVQVAATTDCLDPTGAQEIGSTGVFQCPSADRYINLENVPNARDTYRQSIADLHTLFRSLSENALSAADVGANVDNSNIHFLGMSLGGIVGMPFVAQEADLQTIMLNVATGGIAKLIDGSPTLEPAVTAGLQAAAGVVKPSADYESFLIVVQTLLDNSDPMNFTDQIADGEESTLFWAGAAAEANTTEAPILFQEVVGTGNSADCDTVLDNNNSGCPDMFVVNNTFVNSSLATAWGAVSGSGQTGVLPGQNPDTVPAALSGTDPLTQGTAFVTLAANSLFGDPLVDLGAGNFFGLNLTQVGSAGGAGSGLVRFTSGEHGSLLSPTFDLNVFTVMQTQIVTFAASGGAAIAADPNTGTADQVVRD